MKSVLHIYKDYYPPVMGGVEKTINLMCQGLRNEYEVHVLVANRGLFKAREEINGVEVIKAGCLGRLQSAPLSPLFPWHLRKHQADILHFHLPEPTSTVSYLLSSPRGKVVVTYHSDIVRQRFGLKLYRQWLYRFLDRVDVIMPTSPNYIRSSEFLRRYEKKCQVVPLGIPVERYKKSARIENLAAEVRERFGSGPLVIFVGLLRYYKGIEYLLKAMPRVDAQLLIVGEGPERKRLERLCTAFKLDKKVHFVGFLDEDEKLGYLYAADVFCLPSHLRSEAFGICQLEAMACGVPVVSTNVDTGVPFVNQDGQTGLVVERRSPQALAEALNRLLGDEALRRTYGEHARERVEQEFSVNRMVERVKEVYEGLGEV